MTQEYRRLEPLPLPNYQPGQALPQISPTGAENEVVEREAGWEWIGDTRRPEAKEHDDGISDLFEVGNNEDDTADLISVDIPKDILDVNERGSLDDLTDVSMEDILGDEETGQIPLEFTPDEEKQIREFNGENQQQYQKSSGRRPTSRNRITPDTSLGGMRG